MRTTSKFWFNLKVLHLSSVFSVGCAATGVASCVSSKHCGVNVGWLVYLSPLSLKRETKRSTSGKIAVLATSQPPTNIRLMSFPLIQLLFLWMLYLFSHLWVNLIFQPMYYSMQYSYLIWSTLNKRESCLSAICHLLSSIQQLSVGCSIFLIVANFLVQFYATFTWMFMTLSAATKI